MFTLAGICLYLCITSLTSREGINIGSRRRTLVVLTE
jgi:hypothetical protein